MRISYPGFRALFIYCLLLLLLVFVLFLFFLQQMLSCFADGTTAKSRSWLPFLLLTPNISSFAALARLRIYFFSLLLLVFSLCLYYHSSCAYTLSLRRNVSVVVFEIKYVSVIQTAQL